MSMLYPNELSCRYVIVKGKRRSVRLETVIWRGLGEIALNEDTTITVLCDMVDSHRQNATLASALRVFVISYHRLHDDGDDGQAPGRSRYDPSLRTIAL
jgi:predicted DNA-binding ribbon-helix-helix protein